MTVGENDQTATAAGASRWADLPPTTQAKRWEEVDPGTFKRIMTAVERAVRHDQRMEWASLIVRLIGTLGPAQESAGHA